MRYAIIHSSTTLDSIKGKEALDVTLMLSSFEQEVAIFFLGDGVYQLLPQPTEQVSVKNYTDTFKALSFYDVDDIYVCQDSISERGLTWTTNVPGVQILPASKIGQLLENFNLCLRF